MRLPARRTARAEHHQDPDPRRPQSRPGRRVHVSRAGQWQDRHRPYEFHHELVDIETLNRRAFTGDLELTAVSLHGYAYLTDKYMLCPCGASMGDGYGPMVVATHAYSLKDLRQMTIAVPGTLTTAYLALRMCLGIEFKHVVVPFDEIISAVEQGAVSRPATSTPD